jgi:hypothetical protein
VPAKEQSRFSTVTELWHSDICSGVIRASRSVTAMPGVLQADPYGDQERLQASRPQTDPLSPCCLALTVVPKGRRSFAVAVAVMQRPRDRMSRGHFCWSLVVGRGGVEPPTFRFSGVATTVVGH